ncbi:MAG: heparan-alpha-glucosaminide N-acetyltransferase domain-containing protein [Candidatus Aminicenantia bacterium]
MLDVKKRYLFIDLFRGLAIIKMIEGHVFRALLVPTSSFFKSSFISFLDGLTGPIFLFISGISFSIVLKRHKEDFLRLNKKFFTKIQRVLFIIFVGYWLHLPFFSLRKTFHSCPEIMREFLKADILQCIGVSLLFLQFLFFIFRKESIFNWFVFSIGILILFSTPFVISYDFPIFPLGIESYLKQYPISKGYLSPYPFFHWSTYLLFGYLIGSIFFSLNEKEKEKLFILALTIAGILLYFAGSKSGNLFSEIYGTSFDFWYGSPNIFFMRLGATFTMFSFLYFFERLFVPIARPIKTLGMESLHAYWLHLVILFGSVLPIPTLRKIFPYKLTLIETLFVFFGLITFVYFTSYLWSKLKSKSPHLSKIILRGIVLTFLIIFVIRKY